MFRCLVLLQFQHRCPALLCVSLSLCTPVLPLSLAPSLNPFSLSFSSTPVVSLSSSSLMSIEIGVGYVGGLLIILTSLSVGSLSALTSLSVGSLSVSVTSAVCSSSLVLCSSVVASFSPHSTPAGTLYPCVSSSTDLIMSLPVLSSKSIPLFLLDYLSAMAFTRSLTVVGIGTT